MDAGARMEFELLAVSIAYINNSIVDPADEFGDLLAQEQL